MDKAEVVFRYHEETKHHFNRLARSLGYLDWANQPEPFRFYKGAEQIELPLIKNDLDLSYEHLYKKPEKSKEINVYTVSKFLELALGLSAWKAIPGSQWSLRMNPSSGNLHPTEPYLVLFEEDLNGTFHYNPLLHNLEKLAEIDEDDKNIISNFFKTEGFLIALSSIYWREAWKYGERAFRYCNHDVGHALGSIRFSANLNGWKVKILNAVSDEEISTIFGFDKRKWVKDEKEFPEVLCWVYKEDTQIPKDIPEKFVSNQKVKEFKGVPNRLSEEHVRWEIIYEVSEATKKPKTKPTEIDLPSLDLNFYSKSEFPAPYIIRKRRSAVAYDRTAYMPKEKFLNILDKTLERKDYSPFDIELSSPQINLVLFVHRVKGLEQGLYFFSRDDEKTEIFKGVSSPEFLWEEKENNLFLLYKGNFEITAKLVSCRQDIAGDSCFSLGMLAYFKENIIKAPYSYRHLHWEAGLIGQVLYLEAEAQGFRGTGIGCFFDDAVHEILGLKDNTFQTIYHFTIGKPLEDPRLRTLPPYYHLPENRFIDIKI